MLGNPYTPGAGCIPPYLAGREGIIQSAKISLNRLLDNYPQRSVIYYGLRGVGKTVLLNTLETAAENLEIKYAHIEASEKNLFMKRLLNAFNKFLRQMSVVASVKALANKTAKLITAFSVTYNITDDKLALEYEHDDLVASGIMEDDLTEILVALGRCASNSKNAVCVFVDEFQCITKEQAKALITALHRCNQLRLPIMFFCAGLPKAIQVVNQACSYAERIFIYEEIAQLSNEEAKKAIAEPAAFLGVEYDLAALEQIVKVTEGYPYFIQEFCSTIWDCAEDVKTITYDMVEKFQHEFFDRLDAGFFAARTSRCSKTEQLFMFSMAECSDGCCTIGDLAHYMGKNVKQISTTRAKLIEKGMIYAPTRGELAFTVPLFANYLRRCK